LHPCLLSKELRKLARRLVRMPRVLQPDISIQYPQPRRSQKAHFGTEMPSLFHPILKIARGFLVEKDNQLACRHAIFRPAKAEDISPRFPSDRFRRAAKRRDGIGKARAIHMKEHSVRPRKSANRLDFIRRANRSELRRL